MEKQRQDDSLRERCPRGQLVMKSSVTGRKHLLGLHHEIFGKVYLAQ